MNLRIAQDTVHSICTDDGPIAFFQRHDRIVRFHTSGLPATQGFRHNIRGRDHTGRARGGREVARLLQRRVIVRELSDAPAAHDIGARVTHVK